MISFLNGQTILNGSELTILVNKVGYLVHVNNQLLLKCSKSSDELSLHIYTHVREDALELFGFETWEEKQVFMMLISVNGVGPKTALPMLDHGSKAVLTAIKNADLDFFKKIPRVGKKLAQKIIIELKNKVGAVKELDLGPTSELETEAIEALLALGFPAKTVSEVVKKLSKTETKVEALVKTSIRLIGSS